MIFNFSPFKKKEKLEDLLAIYPAKRDDKRKALLGFILKKDKSGDYTILQRDRWNIFKALYKKAEADPSDTVTLASIIAVIDEIDPLSIDKEKHATSSKTIRYMKRRARRFMNSLAQTNPEQYCAITIEMILLIDLSELPNNIQKELTPYPIFKNNFPTTAKAHYYNLKFGRMTHLRSRWILGDILLGGSKRARQLNNGNGSFVYDWWTFKNKDCGIKYPEVWKKHGQQLSSVLKDLHFPWFIYEFIHDVCEIRKEEFKLNKANQISFLTCMASPCNRLRLNVQQQLMTWLKETITTKGPLLAIDAIVYTFFFANRKDQKWIARYISDVIPKKDDYHKTLSSFFIYLAGYRFIHPDSGYTNNTKLKFSFETIDKYTSKIDLPDVYIKNTTYFICHNNCPNLQKLAMAIMAEDDLNELCTHWIHEINLKDSHQCQAFLELIEKNFSSFDYSKDKYIPFLMYCDFKEVRALGWKLFNKFKVEVINSWYAGNLLRNHLRKFVEKHGFEAFANEIKEIENGVDIFKFFLKETSFYSYDGISDEVIQGIAKDKAFAQTLLSMLSENFEYFPTQCLRIISFYEDNIIQDTLKQFWGNITEIFSKRRNMDSKFETFCSLIKGRDSLVWPFAIQLIEETELPGEFWDCMIRHIEEDEKNLIYRIWLFKILNTNNDKIKPKKNVMLGRLKQGLMHELTTREESRLMAILGEDIIELVWESAPIIEFTQWVLQVSINDYRSIEDIYLERLEELSPQDNIWKEIIDLPEEFDQILEERFWTKDTIKAIFLRQENIEIVDCKNDNHLPIIKEWIDHRADRINENQNLLFKLAANRRPEFRQIAWKLIMQQKMEVHFILRLAEYGIPEVTESAYKWFQQIPTASIQETEGILALCDSPQNEIRQLGLQLIEERKELLDYQHKDLLRCLSEHPDTYVQTRVAQTIEKNEQQHDFTQVFDKQVLRQRNKARKAKESIKTRLEKGLDQDPALLLEMASGHNQKDAEWAIMQLSKLALAGKIDENVFKLI